MFTKPDGTRLPTAPRSWPFGTRKPAPADRVPDFQAVEAKRKDARDIPAAPF